MADEKHSIQITGVGSHQIDIEALDHNARERLMECVRKNGKISILVGHAQAAGIRANGFAQQVD